MAFTAVSRTDLREAFPELELDDYLWEKLITGLNEFRSDHNVIGTDKPILFRCLDILRNVDGYLYGEIVQKLDDFVDNRRRFGEPIPKKMEGGNFRPLKTRGVRGRGIYNFTKTAHRKFLKHAAQPIFDALAVGLPAAVGQPELIPVALAASHAGVAGVKEVALPFMGKNKKREEKLRQQHEEEEEYNQLMNKYKISGKGIMNQPRSRSVGSDVLSPMAAATLGHSRAMNMKLKLEKDMAMGRQKQIGLVGVSGNLLGPGATPALQSQPQQNFQFRHTLVAPAFHPIVYGNNGLYM